MSSDRTVFVGGISWKANEENLKTFFSSFGAVADCKIIVDKNSNKSKGYGFVTFEDPEIAEKVKKSKDLNFMGKTMNASDAYRKNDSPKKSSSVPGNNFDHPGYQSPPYGAVPYAIPIPYYVPSYNPISYVPYVYPSYYGWSPSGPVSEHYYLYQPYDYDTYEDDENGDQDGEGDVENGNGSKDNTSTGDDSGDENTPTANNTETNNTENNDKISDTLGGTDNDTVSITSSPEQNDANSNQSVDG